VALTSKISSIRLEETTEQIPDAARLNLKTRLNGKIMQNGSADDMIFSIPDLGIDYISIPFPLHKTTVMSSLDACGLSRHWRLQFWDMQSPMT
jgi:hypothetical protein